MGPEKVVIMGTWALIKLLGAYLSQVNNIRCLNERLKLLQDWALVSLFFEVARICCTKKLFS
jgi:hypothetical protein